MPISLPHLSSTFAVLNPAHRCKVGRLGDIKAGVETRVIAIRESNDEVTWLLTNLHTVVNASTITA